MNIITLTFKEDQTVINGKTVNEDFSDLSVGDKFFWKAEEYLIVSRSPEEHGNTAVGYKMNDLIERMAFPKIRMYSEKETLDELLNDPNKVFLNITDNRLIYFDKPHSLSSVVKHYNKNLNEESDYKISITLPLLRLKNWVEVDRKEVNLFKEKDRSINK